MPERRFDVNIQDRKQLAKLYAKTGVRLHLEEWDSIKSFHMKDDGVLITVETYDVKSLVREDRYNRRGTRWLVLMPSKSGGDWFIDHDITLWDESFTPYVFEKSGRRQTAEEFTSQRDWELLCYRPGKGRYQLDSYDRVCDPMIRSTKKMEGHW